MVINKETRLLNYLPSIYQKQAESEDDPLKAILIIFDHFFTDIEGKSGNIDTFLDPDLTTNVTDKNGRDFLTWIASWVVLGIDDGWSETKKRYLIKNAAKIYNHRGTLNGLKCILEQFFDIDVEIEEWSWPSGMEIGRRSSIGIDTHLMEKSNIKQCFKVICRSSQQTRPYFIKKIRTIIDLEKPAHTMCYLEVYKKTIKAREEIPEMKPMIIEINSTISFCYISQEE
ncbi:MAG: hypothetical protein GY797_01940 [Deltaproteobacteria bacterium]|nr:hypothetical protein [Deltaproteobacteria bacterium]